MKINNKNNEFNMVKKIHNPKSNQPSVYIPYWLIQVPDNKLSIGSKIIYGRIAQWSNYKGYVHRSYAQLAEETGMTVSPVKRYIAELKSAGLIGTYRKKEGGVNNFEFYDHPWMYEEINKNLCNSNVTFDENKIINEDINTHVTPGLNRPYPGSKQTLPPGLNRPYPGSKQTLLKYKEVIINNNNILLGDHEIKSELRSSFGISDMIKNNPHNIGEDIINDWIKVRSKKRAAVTQTAWKNICKELDKCKEKNLDPKNCFEIAVASGWQSLKVEYFLKPCKNEINKIDNSNTDWARDVFKPFHEMGAN